LSGLKSTGEKVKGGEEGKKRVPCTGKRKKVAEKGPGTSNQNHRDKEQQPKPQWVVRRCVEKKEGNVLTGGEKRKKKRKNHLSGKVFGVFLYLWGTNRK